MEYITVDEAIRSNDLVIGAALIVLTLIAAAMWYGVGIYKRRTVMQTKKLIAKTEKRVREECDREANARGAKLFAQWMDTKAELAKVRKELEDTQACFTALKGDYDNLAATAKDCPAYGTVSKRGMF